MLLSAFISLLVYSTLASSIYLNRLTSLVFLLTLIVWLNGINLVGLSDGLTIYNGWFYLNSISLPLTLLMIILIIVLLTYSTSTHRYHIGSPFFNLLVIANSIGLILLPLANDLVIFYVIVELQSYSLYLLTGLYNRSYNASRAALLYFLIGGIASAIILLSSYFIYSLTGTTSLSDLSMIYAYTTSYDYFNILLIALMFKMGMAPLHQWSISVYNYAPTYITAYISIVAKISIIGWIYIHGDMFNNVLLMIVFYMSLAIASYKPLFQVNIKTLLAYSGLLNFGYILLTVMTYDISFYAYLIQYVLTHTLLFLGLLAAGEYMSNPYSIWSPLVFIHQLRIPNKTLIFALVLSFFSLIGIPPLPGFYAKLYVLIGAIQDNYLIETIAIVVFSVIATYYYANVIKVLISNLTVSQPSSVYLSSTLAYTIGLTTVILISSFMYWPILLEGLYLISV